MESLGKDVIGQIFLKMTPTDWYCCSLVSKSWWAVISKWLIMRKKSFVKCLKDEISLFGLNLPEEKNRLCVRPMYYLQSVGTGCKGKVVNYLCARHKMLSVRNVELCEMCRSNPVSNKCFGDRCNTLSCRDYIYILRDGQAVKVPSYSCRFQDCFKPTDSPIGYCYNHAVANAIADLPVMDPPKYQCIGITKKGERCTFKTSSRTMKCHQHSFSVVSLI